MARTTDQDDAASTGGDDYTLEEPEVTNRRGRKKGYQNPLFDRLFASCSDDAQGSVHRAWAVTIVFMLLFLIIACIEGKKIQEDYDASVALEIAAYYTAFLHMVLAVLGTFVLKRFATAFTVGCFLGVTVVISQQDLLMFAVFFNYKHGDVYSNSIFADLALALFLLLTFFSLILGHFRHQIIEY